MLSKEFIFPTDLVSDCHHGQKQKHSGWAIDINLQICNKNNPFQAFQFEIY